MPKIQSHTESVDHRENLSNKVEQRGGSPDYTTSFQQHGVSFLPKRSWTGDGQAIGSCLFCEKESKFYLNIESGLWDCKVCGESGNYVTFVRKLWDRLHKQVNEGASKLASSRGLLSPNTLHCWGIVYNPHTDMWCIPTYNNSGLLTDLARWTSLLRGSKPRVIPTKYASVGISLYLGDNPSSKSNPLLHIQEAHTIYICEGIWDACILWELLDKDSAVIGVPGCTVFKEAWASLLGGKRVVIAFDNDHTPKGDEDKLPPSLAGAKRLSHILASQPSVSQASDILYLRWDPKGGSYNPSLPSGYDLRDYFSTATDLESRQRLLQTLSTYIVPIPESWIVGDEKDSKILEPKTCTSWGELVDAWRNAFEWTSGLDTALSALIAVVLSTKTLGDPLWLKIIGPPSCGKSVLAEAVGVASRYVISKSTIRGFHSGQKTSDDKDYSLISLIRDKTLIIKDGDTLLRSPNRDQILSEARDLYDGSSRSHYRNNAGKDYTGVKFTWIICGTEALRTLDSSDLGERMLDCVVVDDMDEELEDAIGWRVALQKARSVRVESNCAAITHDTSEMVLAKRLTGGYISYLRENASRLLDSIQEDHEPLRLCQLLGTFVSFMRTKPVEETKKVIEHKVQRELSFRLVAQHVRMAICLAATLGKTRLDEDVMTRVYKIGLDTARGVSLDTTTLLYGSGDTGLESKAVAISLGISEEKTRSLLRFLSKIKVVESFLPNSKLRAGMRARWRLTKRLRHLYQQVISIPPDPNEPLSNS